MKFICEIFVSDATGHCPEEGHIVRFVRDGEARIIMCEPHSERVLKGWETLPITEYAERFGLVQDEPIIGARLSGEGH